MHLHFQGRYDVETALEQRLAERYFPGVRQAVRTRSGFGLALAAACVTGSAHADGRDHHELVPPPLLPRSVVMPVEYSDAVVWLEERKGPVYRMSAGLAPGLLLGRLALHAPLEYYYRIRAPTSGSACGARMPSVRRSAACYRWVF